MSDPSPDSPASQTPPFEIAARWDRLLAAFVDWFLYAVTLMVGFAAMWAGEFSGLWPILGLAGAAALLVTQHVLLIRSGQTIGKRALGIQIVRWDGSAAGFVHAVLLRLWLPLVVGELGNRLTGGFAGSIAAPAMTGVLGVVGIVGLLDVLPIFLRQRRCLHDYVAGTWVANDPSRSGVARGTRALIAGGALLLLLGLGGYGFALALECADTAADCDGNPLNGCEKNVATSMKHCGQCGQVCGRQNADASCNNGYCRLSCDPGHEDCDGDPSNGCEADLRSDAADCGKCGRSCGAARCAEGRCHDRVLYEPEAGAHLSRFSTPAFAVDDDYFYVVEGRDERVLGRVPRAGGALEPLADVSKHETAKRLVVDDRYVHLVTKWNVVHIPKESAKPTQHVTDTKGTAIMATSSGQCVFLYSFERGLRRITPGEWTNDASPHHHRFTVGALAADSSGLYSGARPTRSHDFSLRRFDPCGENPRELVALQHPVVQIALSPSHVYYAWGQGGTPGQDRLAPLRGLARIPKQGGAPEILRTFPQAPASLYALGVAKQGLILVSSVHDFRPRRVPVETHLLKPNDKLLRLPVSTARRVAVRDGELVWRDYSGRVRSYSLELVEE